MYQTIATDGRTVQVTEGRTRDLAHACALQSVDPNHAMWHRVHYARRYGFYDPLLGIDTKVAA